MASLFSFFSKKSKDGSHSLGGGNGDDGIIIQVGTSGFVVREAAGKGEVIAQGDVSISDQGTVDRIEKGIQSAISQTPDKRLKHASSIAVILDSDDTQFIDMRQSSLGAASNERIRDFGVRLTGSKFVSFGRMPFGSGDKNRKIQHGLLGFIDHGALERYLAAMGEHCTRMSDMVPAGSLLVSRAEGFESNTYAGVLIGGMHSTVVVANYRQNTAMVRYIPAGRDSLVAAVASQASMSEAQVLSNFGQRDYFRTLIDKERGGNTDLTIGPIEDAMIPHLRIISAEILNTIEYFEEQLGAEKATSLELLGDSEQLKGFRDWLQAATDLDVQRVDAPVVDTFRHGNKDKQLNLLTGLEGNPILVGKSRYTLQDNRLVKSAPPKKKPKVDTSGKPRGPQGGGASSRRKAAAAAPQGEGLFAKFFKRGADEQLADEEDANNFSYFFLFFAIIFGVLWWGYQKYDAMNQNFINIVGSYANELAETKRLRQGLTDLGVRPTLNVSGEGDQKILWTEKFLALSEQMNKELWLTDVYVEDGVTTFGDNQLTTKRLAIEGAALPSSEGHIAEIADFIQRLERDDDRFMTDFRLVDFEGSQVDTSDRERIVRFTLSAWYDKSKRSELAAIQAAKKKEDGSPLSTMQKNVAKHNEQLEKALGGELPR